ncbi:hypothetical protein P691DRAFT_816432 [Macrolepiota fuliginosa MF-IS2]|uniref:G domain-containing protein n=1 Tax=Macrolepiota fuliginosa MF-IS2 TaxID=1400762 RepID=A0A9P5WYN4_9AGAR|nr:hypothetical protein P691DRAFT_816432 [Macrolepiota fuliginosa MF-IS2]
MGPTGAGKSTFISTAIGRDIGIDHSLRSSTSRMSAIRVTIMDMQVVLVDTPGFDDTHLSDLDVLKMVSDWLQRTFEKGLKLSGILYMHRISDNRMARTSTKSLNMFRRLCGEENFKKVILTTTMWPDTSDREATSAALDREGELKRTYWLDMIKGGSRTLWFENTQKSAWRILDELIAPCAEQRPILIQHELVTLKKPLQDTVAGQQLYDTVKKLTESQMNNLRRIKEELKNTSDLEVMQVLLDELSVVREEREKAMLDRQWLEPTLVERLRRLLRVTRVSKPAATAPFEERSRSLFLEILQTPRGRFTRICELQGDEAQCLADFLGLVRTIVSD